MNRICILAVIAVLYSSNAIAEDVADMNQLQQSGNNTAGAIVPLQNGDQCNIQKNSMNCTDGSVSTRSGNMIMTPDNKTCWIYGSMMNCN